jgi:flagellar P-ring protein precursor FlgI
MMNNRMRLLIIGLTISLIILCKYSFSEITVRIKDLCRPKQVRENQLLGYGLVVGLRGSGDTKRSIFTVQSVVNMLKHFGVFVEPEKLGIKNIAAVVVTADVSAFFKEGDRIDVTVSAIGDAKDLKGGVLLQTPLLAGDGKIYAVAQGELQGEGCVTYIPKGALVEKSIPFDFYKDNKIELVLKEPDFTNASKIAAKINEKYADSAKAKDPATVEVTIPKELQAKPVDFLADIENLSIEPVMKAKVVISRKTGTIIMGKDIKIDKVAIAHEGISLKVGEKYENVFSMKEAPTVDDIVKALNAIGARPKDIIAILEALKKAQALHAELVIF